MLALNRLRIAVLLAILVAAFAGCGGGGSPYPDGLAGLSDTERSAALEQRACPVCGEVLGASGPPVKVAAEGQEVFVCSGDCEQQFTAEPKKYQETLQSIADE